MKIETEIKIDLDEIISITTIDIESMGELFIIIGIFNISSVKDRIKHFEWSEKLYKQLSLNLTTSNNYLNSDYFVIEMVYKEELPLRMEITINHSVEFEVDKNAFGTNATLTIIQHLNSMDIAYDLIHNAYIEAQKLYIEKQKITQ